jgi:quercetin dioxygenase-like cupin family protein
MQHSRLEDMVKGWFVGSFSPAAYQTGACEVAVKYYQAGDIESEHFHKVATEVTLVLSGRVEMFGRVWMTGDIIIIEPGEKTNFIALTDAINVVVKVPGTLNDKYHF